MPMISRISLIRQLTVLGEEEDGTMDRDRFSMATRRQLHAPLERTGTEAHEGNPILVLRVHIGLHLEDEDGDVVPFRVDRLRFGGERARGRGVRRKRGEQCCYAGLLERGDVINRRQVAITISGHSKIARLYLSQFRLHMNTDTT